MLIASRLANIVRIWHMHRNTTARSARPSRSAQQTLLQIKSALDWPMAQ